MVTLSGFGSNTGMFNVNDGVASISGELFSPFTIGSSGTLQGTSATGTVFNDGGSYVDPAYIVTIPGGSPESALHGDAAFALYSGSLFVRQRDQFGLQRQRHVAVGRGLQGGHRLDYSYDHDRGSDHLHR